jgi:hypothetical protein
MQLPAKNLTDAFNACDPATPLDADDPRYVDLTAGRGDEGNAVKLCRKRILRSERPRVQLFAGHRGSGKSTELRRLQKQLEADGYFVAFFEIDGDLDLQDPEPVDVLLALVRNLEEQLREGGFQVSQKHMDDFLSWFGTVVLDTTEYRKIEAEASSEIRLGAEVPILAKLMARFTGQIRTGNESKKNIRRRLDSQISHLVDRGRLLVSAARSQVQKAGHKDLVIIADNLDRVALVNRGVDRTSHDVVFIERGELLKGFGCHTIVTVPISLLFSPKIAVLKAIFPHRHIVPMVKIFSQESREAWPPGRRLLEEVLRKRVDVDLLLEEGVVKILVEMSGGHPRLLMNLMVDCIDFVEDAPITQVAARKAVRRLMNDYDRSIPEKYWPLLVKIHQEGKVLNDEDHQLMLFNLMVLEYQNEQRWCDVLPAIRDLPRFQTELQGPKKIQSS